ncbi:MAG: hypothetical protein KQH63_06655 [Desulfobulbaceae bacterium]|nr:hypothetical protein [Desulfobulbaceae bacterium]
MFKLITSIFLSLAFAFLVRESVVSFRSADTQAQLTDKTEKQSPNRSQNTGAPVKFYPAVPSPLPDLKKGYLFNEERLLVDDSAVAEITEESPTEGDGPAVDMSTVFYSGSIIIGDLRKGLISYSEAKAQPVKKTKTRARTATKPKKTKYTQLVAGDTISGYKVVSVEPDRIIFEKGTEKIEKTLNDPGKVRLVPPAPQKKKVVKKPTVKTARSKRVQLDRAKRGIRTTTTTRTVKKPAIKSSTQRGAPNARIQIPGVPTPK